MSPKSRGRPPGRGRAKRRQTAARPLTPADLVLRDAELLTDVAERLSVEVVASGWLGEVWAAAGLDDREAEADLILAIAARAQSQPSARAMAAVAALRTVAPADQHALLDETLEVLREQLPAPVWSGDVSWLPTAAWRASDPWGSRFFLLVQHDGPQPHTLFADVSTPGGAYVLELHVLEPDAVDHFDEVAHVGPMTLEPAPADEVLAELASVLGRTDMVWPRNDDPEFAEIRRLAWARARAFAPEPADWEPLPDAERARLIDDFVAGPAADLEAAVDTVRSVADLFIDYGDGYVHGGHLAWSPGEVELFLADWLPRKAVLDAEQLAVLPDALRRWVRFALELRGVEEEWIEPVVAAVEEFEEQFRTSYDDEASWGPARQVVALLQERGVDLDDQAAVEQAIQAFNAEQLARRLLEDE
jgi:hypothetical protein